MIVFKLFTLFDTFLL